DHQSLTSSGLFAEHRGLTESADSLSDLLPDLSELLDAPEAFFAAMADLEWEVDAFEAAMARKSLNASYRENRSLNRFEGWIMRRHALRAQSSYDEWMKLNGRRIVNRTRGQFLESNRISGLPAAQLTQEQKPFKKTFNKGRRELEHEFGKTMRYKSIRDLASNESGQVVLQLKPIWLMSPLSISDTLPLETDQFDVVIFDEASQIKLEEAIPAVYRANQIIVVGDEMQLPPTNFFGSSSGHEELLSVEDAGETVEFDLNADSFLAHSARNLPATLLGWHYRSRHEALISFSNNAFYSGELLTIPDRKAKLGEDGDIRVADPSEANVPQLLERSISFHQLEEGVYENRRNPAEARYIAAMVKDLLERDTGLSIGIVAFSEAQQAELELALDRLGREDSEFANRLSQEFDREEDDQFCGLFVKNLENVQGDERDLIILSICYAPDRNGKMRMNFGPINQTGGEKRLNVIFSRARIHMAVVSSIEHHAITNDYNDGARCLKGFLQYAAAVSRNDPTAAEHVLGYVSTAAEFAGESKPCGLTQLIADALRKRGLDVEIQVGQSRFKADLAVREPESDLHQVAVIIDNAAHYEIPNLLERYLQRPGILKAFGWTVFEVLAKDWYHAPEDVLRKIESLVREPNAAVEHEDEPEEEADEMADEVPEPEIEAEEEPATPEEEEAVSAKRYFELVDEKSSKFWEITQINTEVTVRYGRIGNNGQSRTKSLETSAAANSELEKAIRAKIAKGYQEKEI
ncbi:MAG: AAA domain-containing protein, partial [Verrucomicrobiota bacterium]